MHLKFATLNANFFNFRLTKSKIDPRINNLINFYIIVIQNEVHRQIPQEKNKKVSKGKQNEERKKKRTRDNCSTPAHVHSRRTTYKQHYFVWKRKKTSTEGKTEMGSIDTSTRAESGSDPIPTPNSTANGHHAGNGSVHPPAVESTGATAENEPFRKRKGSGVLPRGDTCHVPLERRQVSSR